MPFLLLGLLAFGPGLAAHAQDSAPPPRAAAPAPRAPHSLLLDVTRAGSRLVAVGERGHILVSEDGQNWRQSSVPVRTTLTAVTFTDDKSGWAVGHDATILHSSDGGLSWTIQHRAPDDEQPLLDVFFTPDGTGFAIGAYGLCLRTENTGQVWYRRQVDEEDFHLNAIAADSSGHLYIAGEAGHLWRSDDRGQTWQSLPSPYQGSWFGITTAGGELLTWGLQGRLYRSSDQGQNWTPLATGTRATLLGGGVWNDELLVVGAFGTLLSGPPAGPLVLRTLPDRTLLSAVARLDANWVAVGERGARVLDPGP